MHQQLYFLARYDVSSDDNRLKKKEPTWKEANNGKLWIELWGEETSVFAITSPVYQQAVINDSWITVDGTCTIEGQNRIGFANGCTASDFQAIQYTTACVNGEFSGQMYKGNSNWIVARDIESISSDCMDYDELMTGVEVDGFDAIEGYADDWYATFNYYQDYNIKIKSPNLENSALTLPITATSSPFTFAFDYPESEIADLNFNIKQYDKDGNLLNANYLNENLANMADTDNYQAIIIASSTQALNYVVQLTKIGELKRQFPFSIFVSDLDFVYNSDDYNSFFPRLTDELKKKIIFNYYFAFYDGFQSLFANTASSTAVSDGDLDITFKSMSDDGEYNLDIPIFSASDERVKSVASGLRPYISAILWLIFASYVVFRITHLFSDNE